MSEDMKVGWEFAKLAERLSADDRMIIQQEVERVWREIGRLSTYVAVIMQVLTEEPEEEAPQLCSVCGGEGEHDWEVHNAELRANQEY
jgi:hypothetical protein